MSTSRTRLAKAVKGLREKLTPPVDEIHRRLTILAMRSLLARRGNDLEQLESVQRERKRLEALLPPRTPKEEAGHQAKIAACRETLMKRFKMSQEAGDAIA
jgi:hypothetical protein